VSMLSPGGVGRSRPYTPPRRRGARLLRVVAVLAVFALLGGATWYFVLREPPSKSKPKAAACPTLPAKPVAATQPPRTSRPPRTSQQIVPRQVTVNVYNATKRQGLAARTAAAMRQRGFVIGKIANDPLRKTLAGSAEVRSGVKGKSRAPLVAAHVAGAVSVVDKRTDLTVDLVLGARFTALRTPEQVTALLTSAKPPGC
jgi:hypothetical protein